MRAHTANFLLQEALSSLNDSVLAHRIVAELYEEDADHENAIKISESGLELVRRIEQNWGRPLKQYVFCHEVYMISHATS